MKKLLFITMILIAFWSYKALTKQSLIPECYADLEYMAPTPQRPFLMSYQEEAKMRWLYCRSFLDLLWEGEHDTLDACINRFRKKKERFIGGNWKLQAVYARIANFEQTDESLENFHQKILKWTYAKPDSFNARLLLAKYWYEAAWHARGGGFASTVAEEGWDQFRVNLLTSKKLLEKISRQGKKCPYYYNLLIDVTVNLEGRDAARVVLDEAMDRFPGYLYFHETIAFHLLPRWGGSDEDIVLFAGIIRDRIGGNQGDIAYLQTVKTIFRNNQKDREIFFDRFLFDWDTLQRAYETQERLYGRSHKISAFYFRLADAKGDTETVHRLHQLFEENWSEEEWGKRKYALKIRKKLLSHPEIGSE